MKEELLHKFEEIESRHWWWEGRRRLVKDFLESLGRKKEMKILDVGCGTGETISFIKRTSKLYEVWGIDNSLVAVKYARGRGHKTIKLADAKKLPFANNKFDAILVLDVLEHINRPATVLKEIKRVLKPGGKVLITSPALKFIWSAHDAGQGHNTRFDKDELRVLAERSGLRLEIVRYFNFFFSGPIILVRSLSRWPILRFLASYDNGINYSIVDIKPLNELLKVIFVAEAAGIRKINYPWGVSIMAVMIKPRM